MVEMFYECFSLKELNLFNFNTNKVMYMRCMFYGCSEQFKNKIRAEYKNIKEEAYKTDRYDYFNYYVPSDED